MSSAVRDPATETRMRLQAKTRKLDQFAGSDVALSDDVLSKIIRNAEADPARAILILANKGSATLGSDNDRASFGIVAITKHFPTTADHAITQLLRIPGDEVKYTIFDVLRPMTEHAAEVQLAKFEHCSRGYKFDLIHRVAQLHPNLADKSFDALIRIATPAAHTGIRELLYTYPGHTETVFNALAAAGSDDAARCISDTYRLDRKHVISVDHAIAGLTLIASEAAIELMGRLEQHERGTATGARKIIAALRNIGSDQAVALIALNAERHSTVRLDAIQVLQSLRGEAVAAQRNDLATFDQPIRNLLDTAFTLKGIEEMDRDERPLYRAAFAAADASAPEKPSYCKLFDRAVRHFKEDDALKRQFLDRKYAAGTRQPG